MHVNHELHMCICGILYHAFVEHACIINQNINFPKPPACVLYGLVHLAAVADIHGVRQETVHVRFHLIHHSGQVVSM